MAIHVNMRISIDFYYSCYYMSFQGEIIIVHLYQVLCRKGCNTINK